MVKSDGVTIWGALREYATTQSGSFTSQEALSWFRRHALNQVSDQTVRTHIRGACWNVGDRSQFANREPFLTRIDRGVFRQASAEEVAAWRLSQPTSTQRTGPESAAGANASEEWHTEANVQAAVVSALAATGWRILSVANTATKERGVDIIAERDGATVGIEVKGFPSKNYADPGRAAETKRTRPSTQAGHWYSQALLAAMRLRGREPAWQSAIALPDFDRYRTLYAETATSLEAAQIGVYWVFEDGTVSAP